MVRGALSGGTRATDFSTRHGIKRILVDFSGGFDDSLSPSTIDCQSHQELPKSLLLSLSFGFIPGTVPVYQHLP